MRDERGEVRHCTSQFVRTRLAIVIVAILVLIASLSLVSLSLATMLAASWDPCSWMGAVIFMPLPAYLALQQYRATFHNDAVAAFRSSMILFVIGGFALFAFAMTLGELVIESIPLPWGSLLTPILLFGLATFATAVINFRWYRRLIYETPLGSKQHARYGLRRCDLVAGLLCILFMSSVTAYYLHEILPRWGENVSVDQGPAGLPSRATDVSFCQGYRGTIAYEFTIDEAGFVKWVESGIGSLESAAAKVPIKPIEEPFTISRYSRICPELNGRDVITIDDGLYYHWSKEDQGVYAAFDRASNRAYYDAHFY